MSTTTKDSNIVTVDRRILGVIIAALTVAAIGAVVSPIVSAANAQSTTPAAGTTVISTTGFIDQASILMTQAAEAIGLIIAITTAIVAWIRAKTGTKIIDDKSYARFKWVVDNAHATDQELVTAAHAAKVNETKVDAMIQAISTLSLTPEQKTTVQNAIDQAQQKIETELNPQLAKDVEELKTIYSNVPKQDSSASSP